MLSFSKHPDIKISVEYPGEERQPVVLVDNLVNEVDELVDFACQREFAIDGGYYPGMRLLAPEAYKTYVLDALQDTLIDVFNLSCKNLVFTFSCFSIVNTAKEKLRPIQRIPHYDSTDLSELASVHFLFKSNKFGGTSFYRHKGSGYEYVDSSREEKYTKIMNHQSSVYPPPPAEYINGDTDLYTRIKSWDGIFNRALFFRRTSLHSGNIGKDFKPDLNPLTGRLSITSFLERSDK